MARSNVALIGFMGAGKSAVGRMLAIRTNRSFVETDSLVEEYAEMSIADIFSRFGEERFRDLEAEVVSRVAQMTDTVISCGGGVALREQNVAWLKTSSVVVFLDVTPETVLQRIGPGSKIRPLLDGPDRDSRVRHLMEERQPIYCAAADITVQTDRIPIDQVVERVEEELVRV